MSHKSSLSKRTGNYGKRKYQVLRILSLTAIRRGRDGYLSTRELAIFSGVPYRSLTRCLPKWCEWEYVKRRPATYSDGHMGDYEYCIMPHGKSWLDLAEVKLRNRPLFYDELNKWFAFAQRNWYVLRTCKFDKLIELLRVVKTQLPPVTWSTIQINVDKQSKQYIINYDDSLLS